MTVSDSVGRVYDKMAPIYNWIFGYWLEGARGQAIKELNIQSGEKVLEVGVGNGFTFKYLKKDTNFTGIDLSEKMLLGAHKRALSMDRGHYKLIQMNAAHLDFPENSFDAIISAHFLSATSNPIEALLEMKRVLKKSGRILLVNNFQNNTDAFHTKALEPLAQKMGFSLQLDLNEITSKTGLHIYKRVRVSRVLPVDAVILMN